MFLAIPVFSFFILKIMKHKITLYTLVFVTICLTGGWRTKVVAQDKTIDTAQLVLRFDATYTGSIGWGDVYKCKVTEAIKGNLEDTVVILFITVNNYDSIFFRETPKTKKKSEIGSYKLKGWFRQIENDQPYVNFRNAFIDQKKRTWELFDLKRE